MPFRAASGPSKGQLHWHKPHRETLRQLWRHPASVGAYTWGRRGERRRGAGPGPRGHGRVEREPHACLVFLPDQHPAYLSGEQYVRNRQRLQQQRARGPLPGPARTTTAVLAGLVFCGPGGCRRQTRYTPTLRSVCQRHALD
jgi:hypothetical protein